MRKPCLLLATILLSMAFAGSVHAQFELEDKPGLSASWYNANQNGHGFETQVLDANTLGLYWYTYRPDGTSTFLLGVLTRGAGADEWQGQLFQTEGMTFADFDPNDNEIFVWGEATVSFSDCQNGNITWITDQAGYSNGSIDFQRLTTLAGLACIESSVAGNFAVTLNDEGERLIGEAMLLPDGALFYVYRDTEVEGIGQGTWSQSGSRNFSFNATTWLIDPAGNTPYETEPYSGGGILTKDGFTGGGSALLSGTRLPSFNNPVSAADLADSYTVVDSLAPFQVASLTVSASGAINGTLINGCSLSGQITVPTPGVNQLQVEVFSPDSDPICDNSGFVGAGFVIDATDLTEPNDLEIWAVNEARGFATVFKFRR